MLDQVLDCAASHVFTVFALLGACALIARCLLPLTNEAKE